MTARTALALALVMLLSACTTAPSARKINSISIGMTEAEVISVMGRPDSKAAKEGVEYMNYRLATSALDFDGSDTADYFVRFVNGRVDAFGHKGDFDTAAEPTKRVEIKIK
jgi:predicted butyrate kinase (DUF1464 family)